MEFSRVYSSRCGEYGSSKSHTQRSILPKGAFAQLRVHSSTYRHGYVLMRWKVKGCSAFVFTSTTFAHDSFSSTKYVSFIPPPTHFMPTFSTKRSGTLFIAQNVCLYPKIGFFRQPLDAPPSRLSFLMECLCEITSLLQVFVVQIISVIFLNSVNILQYTPNLFNYLHRRPHIFAYLFFQFWYDTLSSYITCFLPRNSDIFIILFAKLPICSNGTNAIFSFDGVPVAPVFSFSAA